MPPGFKHNAPSFSNQHLRKLNVEMGLKLLGERIEMYSRSKCVLQGELGILLFSNIPKRGLDRIGKSNKLMNFYGFECNVLLSRYSSN